MKTGKHRLKCNPFFVQFVKNAFRNTDNEWCDSAAACSRLNSVLVNPDSVERMTDWTHVDRGEPVCADAALQFGQIYSSGLAK